MLSSFDQRIGELGHDFASGFALIDIAAGAADRAHDARANAGIERHDTRLRGKILDDDAIGPRIARCHPRSGCLHVA